MMMRLDKFLSEASPYSRKEIKKLAMSGAVCVDGVPVRSSDTKVDENAAVSVDGEVFPFRRFIYLMLNKPQGYLSATEDKVDPVVVELIPEPLRHFQAFPVGRLDKDTEGLLLLTNDGHFDHALTSPKKEVFKRYFARLDRPAEPGDIEAFRAGMTFQDFTARPALLELTGDPCEVYIEIAEGKFHQVKRMCERVGKTVTFLKRVSIGGLRLDPDLPSGAVRELTDKDFAAIPMTVPPCR